MVVEVKTINIHDEAVRSGFIPIFIHAGTNKIDPPSPQIPPTNPDKNPTNMLLFAMLDDNYIPYFVKSNPFFSLTYSFLVIEFYINLVHPKHIINKQILIIQ